MNTPAAPQTNAVTSLLLQAQGLVNENRLKDAAQALHQVFTLEPGNPVALHVMADISLRRGHLDTAWKLAYQSVQRTPAIDNVLLLARIAKAMGNLDEAINWYKVVLKDFPDNTAALTHVAQIYDEAGYRSLAIEYCERAQPLMPYNFAFLRGISKLVPYANVDRVYRLYERARPPATLSIDQRLIFQTQFVAVKEAVERAKRGLPSQARSLEDLFFNFARDELKTLEDMADRALEDNPTLLIALASKAACVLISGDVDRSEKLFQACSESDPNGLYQNLIFGSAFYNQLSTMEDAALSANLPLLVDVLTPAFVDAPIVFLSCDTKYFHRFTRPLLLSLNDVASGAQVHVHVMNATGESLDVAKSFCESLANIRVAMSTEDMSSRAKDLMSARNYFHAIRFTRMLQYLNRYQKPLWLMDVDALMNRDPRPIFESVGDGDIALYGHAGRLEPWVQFNASIVGIRPSPRGVKYLRLVAAYINYFYERDKLRWGIDQLAMFGVYNFLKSTEESFVVRLVPDNVLDGEYISEGIIWTNGTAAKFSGGKALVDVSAGEPDSPRIRYFKALDKYAVRLQ